MGSWQDTPEGKRVTLRHEYAITMSPDLKRIGRVWGTPTFWVVKDGRLVGQFASFRNKLKWWEQFREILAKAEASSDARPR